MGYATAEQTPARFKTGTLARIDAALKNRGRWDQETRADFIRAAVEAELARRLAGRQVDLEEAIAERNGRENG